MRKSTFNKRKQQSTQNEEKKLHKYVTNSSFYIS